MRSRHLFFCLFVVLFMFSVESAAQTVPQTAILDEILKRFQGLQAQWFRIIVSYAWRLFWLLAGIDFAWSAITWVLERKEFGELLVALVRKIFVLGFFALLLQMSNAWIPAIIESFTQIGKAACGTTCGTLSPDGIFIFGVNMATDLIAQLVKLNFIETVAMALPVGIVSVLVCLAFALIAGQLVITLIESYIAIGAGVIMLGFGGSRWTSDLSSSYLKFAVGTGIKIMISYIVVGAGMALFNGMVLQVNAEHAQGLVTGSLVLGAQALVFVFLSWNIPSLAAGIVSGSPSSTLGGFMATATTAGAAVAGGAAAAGGLARGTAANATGLAQALEAGHAASREMGMNRPMATMTSVPKAIGAMGKAVGRSSGNNFDRQVSQTLGGRAAENIKAETASKKANQTETPDIGSGVSSDEQAASSNSGQTAFTGDGGVISNNAAGASSTSTASGSSGAVSSPSSQGTTTATSPGKVSVSSGSTTTASNRTSAMGNASGANLNAGTQAAYDPKYGTPQEREAMERTWAQAIKGLEAYVPQDAASVQVSGINLSHGKDEK